MEITRDKIRKYGKLAGIGVVGAGIGAGALNQTDSGPTQDEYQNLQDKVDNLNETNSDLQEQLDNRPTQEVVDSLEEEIDTKEATISDLQDRYTEEEVNEMIAEAKEREGLVDFLPVIVDGEVELDRTSFEVDQDATTLSVGDDYSDDGEYDSVGVDYLHDDGHTYNATVYKFEESGDAEEYEEERRDELKDNREDIANEDYKVIREGDTVVVLTGDEKSSETGYDFDSITGQY